MRAIAQRQRFYPVRKPLVAFLAGAAIALLAGFIGLGGAEFRLPVLIMVFALYAHRAVRINLLISLATLVAASVARVELIPQTRVFDYLPEIVAMSAAGIVAAWIGAGLLGRIPRHRILPVISILLVVIALLLGAEAFFHDFGGLSLSSGTARSALALILGLVIGAVSSLLGVAGGEFIIPGLVLLFGADIHTAGTASVFISIPIVLAGVTRHFLGGKYRSTTMLAYLVLPMSLGSIAGAVLGGLVSASAPQDLLRLMLAAILVLSAWKLWRRQGTQSQRPGQGE